MTPSQMCAQLAGPRGNAATGRSLLRGGCPVIAGSVSIGCERVWGVAVAVCLTLTACGSAQAEDPTPTTPTDPPEAPDRSPPAAGWRWESSRGVELAVPADWKINDTDCNQTDAPSIVRAQLATDDCLTPEPASKEIVEIFGGEAGNGVQLPRDSAPYDVSLGDEPAERAEGMTGDGRFAGWLRVPRLNVVIEARVHERDTLTRVLDSARVVDVDHNGCATARADIRPKPPATRTLVASDTRALSVCLFGGSDVLLASSWLEGDAAAQVVTKLNEAGPGANPDVPETQCARTEGVPPVDAMLIAQGTQESAIVEVSFSGCTNRGLRNGRDTSRVSLDLVQAIMEPLHTGYGFSPL